MDRALARHPAVAHVLAQRVAVDLADEVGVRPQRPQLGAEQQGAAEAAVVERLLADPVARQGEAPRAPVPERQGEHALRAAQRLLDAPLLDRGQQHLGVGVAAEAVPARPERGPQAAEVVDLAVQDQDVAARGGGHRLAAGGREVDDGEPPVAERHAGPGVGPGPGVVGPAVAQRVRHGAGDAPEVAASAAAEKARYPAHRSSPVSP